MAFPFTSPIKFPDIYLYFELKINKHITDDRKNQIYGHETSRKLFVHLYWPWILNATNRVLRLVRPTSGLPRRGREQYSRRYQNPTQKTQRKP